MIVMLNMLVFKKNLKIEEIMLEPDAGKYFFVNQGMLTIDKVDDAQEMRDTKKAFDILMFTHV